MIDAAAIERRITLRLVGYWEKLRGTRSMPVEDDIDPDDLQDLWDYCFLIHTKDLNKPDYNYTYLGRALETAYDGQLTADHTGSHGSLNASKLSGSYKKVISEKVPHFEEGQFTNLHNDIVKYRQCLLPLGENGRVDAIFGGMRFKIFPRREHR